ncbi:MAG: TonB-dependent receptor [Bacteroidales bacterium]|nr:TonB-dependent receptor [Bacteroidales bacterium]
MNKIKLIPIIALFTLVAVNMQAQLVYLQSDTIKMPQVLLDEITIRAPKEKTTVRELPGSVSIVTSRTINEAGIKTVKDITSLTPNFFMPDYGSKLTSPVYIRGIGSRINEPSIGLYVDNVPYFDKAAFDFDFFDIERIEVLRGPQGTLYGRNTMGGIINIITRSPLDFTGTRFMVSAGSYGQYAAGISHFANPVANFGYSLSLNYRHNDGFFTNQFNDSKVDHMDLYGFRNRLVWKVNDRLTLENVLGMEFSNQGGYPYALVTDTANVTGEINYNHESGYDRDLLSNGFIASYKAGAFDVVATTSYQYLNDFQDVDQDFTANPLFIATQAQLQNMVSQEVILKSNKKQRYEWLVGAYGFYQEFDRNVAVSNLPANMLILRDFTETKQGLAVFHQSTVNDFLLKNLSLVLGVRFDLETNQLAFSNNVLVNENPFISSDTLFPSMQFTVVSPKVALNYYMTENSNVYALVSKGYKTGGFNAIYEDEEDLMFDPEQSWNYEVGFKTSLMQNKLQMEAALFYIDWSNQQIYQTVPSGQGSMLKNAGHSVSKGAELSARARLPYNFETMLSYGFTHATFISHVVNDNLNYNGNFIPYIPKHTFAIQLNKMIEFPENPVADRMKISALYRGVGEHYWNESNGYAQSAYGIADLKLRVERNKLGLDIWVRNLLNTDYSAFYFEAIGNRYYQPEKPFNFGINLTLSL